MAPSIDASFSIIQPSAEYCQRACPIGAERPSEEPQIGACVVVLFMTLLPTKLRDPSLALSGKSRPCPCYREGTLRTSRMPI